MTARISNTLLAALVLALVAAGPAWANPITVNIGQWSWTEDEFQGVTFSVLNTSAVPQPELGPETGWTADDFVNLAISVTGPFCGAGPSPCVLDALSLLPGGQSLWPSPFVFPGEILGATLSFGFKGTALQFSLDAQDLLDGDIRIADRSLTYEFEYTPIPEPSSLLLFAGAAGVAAVRRRRA